MKTAESEDAAKLKRDEETRLFHEQALARGEKRVLARTSKDVNRELHSYLPDEIGYSRKFLGAVVSSTTGMFVIAGLLALGCLTSLAVLVSPVFSGEGPAWGVLFQTLVSAVAAVFGFKFGMQDVRAKKVRRQRGVPDPVTFEQD